MRLVRKLTLLAVMAAAVTTWAAPSTSAQVTGTEPLFWPAPATSKLEISSEQTGTMCPAVTPDPPPAMGAGNFTTGGGCYIHLTGTEMRFDFHLEGGMEILGFVCDIEADLRISNKGLGYLTHQEMTPNVNEPNACDRRPCHYPNAPTASYVPPGTPNGTHNEPRPWRMKTREIGTQSEVVTVLFCVEPRATASLEPAPKIHCELTLPLTERENGVPTNHRYEFGSLNAPGTGNPRCELQGFFITEMTQLQGLGPTESARGHIEINHVP